MLDADLVEARANAARSQAALGRTAAAVATWLAAIRRAPDDPEPRLGLAALCTTTVEPDVVRAALAGVAKDDPARSAADDGLAVLRGRR